MAERILQEYNEEIEGARKFIERIIELGAEPNIESEKWTVQLDIENQLRVEYQEQEMALEALNGIISAIQNDEVTKQLFKDYLLNETHHTEWLKQQLNLIESTGLKNYLASQI